MFIKNVKSSYKLHLFSLKYFDTIELIRHPRFIKNIRGHLLLEIHWNDLI